MPLRFVTAASLFDGHDASINIMRRMLQAAGVEVIHLAHNRYVDEVIRAAELWASAHRKLESRLRFDVVAIDRGPEEPTIRHERNAFDAEGS